GAGQPDFDPALCHPWPLDIRGAVSRIAGAEHLGLERLDQGAESCPGMKPRTICLHGPESTGKSTLAPLLAAHFGGQVLDEYGRDYAEAKGTDFTMSDLLQIAKTHDAWTQVMIGQGADPLILDTDPLMTAVWADMLFGTRDPWFDAWSGTADFYLLFDM